MTFTRNKMAWLPLAGSDGTKILHLKPAGESQYRPYTVFPALMRADHRIQGGSRGYATMQYLLTLNWDMESSEVAAQANEVILESA